MLSPASALEVLAGKGIITFLTSLIVSILSVEISDRAVHHYPVLMLLISLTTIFFIGLGTLIGLISSNVMQSSVIGLPIMFVFFIGSIIKDAIDIQPIVTVLEWLPSRHLIDGMNLTMASNLGNEIYSHFLIIAAWTVAILLICLIIYKKKKFDEN
ncbi:ABC-2 type transport system permease protein [Bacillus capparidis]|uniref:ABC-2 type transport system permease protein n=1 Tax=Bacillus capparidis TaxID=1840411 RepID=A0ABS4D334_9BACI|nr:ABC-2 type transport system permease protein [Bacillus capparidis]